VGELLLTGALRRILDARSTLALFAIIVDVKDDKAIAHLFRLRLSSVSVRSQIVCSSSTLPLSQRSTEPATDGGPMATTINNPTHPTPCDGFTGVSPASAIFAPPELQITRSRRTTDTTDSQSVVAAITRHGPRAGEKPQGCNYRSIRPTAHG